MNRDQCIKNSTFTIHVVSDEVAQHTETAKEWQRAAQKHHPGLLVFSAGIDTKVKAS